MLNQRLKTALFLIVPLLIILYIGGKLLTLLALVLYLGINYEFYSFSLANSIVQQRSLTAASCLIPYGYFVSCWNGIAVAVLIVILFGFILQLILAEGEPHEVDLLHNLGSTTLGVCYTGVLGVMLVVLTIEVPVSLISWFILCVIFTDTAAYFGGKAIGGAKFAPRISPKKTLSGAICGIIGAIFAAILGQYLLEIPLSLLVVILFGFLVSLFSIVGDLVESMIKRAYDIKDSGSILPGHGGLLDRVDALLFASPILFFISYL